MSKHVLLASSDKDIPSNKHTTGRLALTDVGGGQGRFRPRTTEASSGGGIGSNEPKHITHTLEDRSRKYKRSASGVVPSHHQRTWLKVGTTGVTEEHKGDKRALAQILGLQQRELRFLDPQTAATTEVSGQHQAANNSSIKKGAGSSKHPQQAAATMTSSISGRSGAILVNLEFIKCVVTREYIYVLELDHPQVPYLLADLKTRLCAQDDAPDARPPGPPPAGQIVLGPNQSYFNAPGGVSAAVPDLLGNLRPGPDQSWFKASHLPPPAATAMRMGPQRAGLLQLGLDAGPGLQPVARPASTGGVTPTLVTTALAAATATVATGPPPRPPPLLLGQGVLGLPPRRPSSNGALPGVNAAAASAAAAAAAATAVVAAAAATATRGQQASSGPQLLGRSGVATAATAAAAAIAAAAATAVRGPQSLGQQLLGLNAERSSGGRLMPISAFAAAAGVGAASTAAARGPNLSAPLPIYRGPVQAGVATNAGMTLALPFELKALEICLDKTACHFESLASDLETSTVPALDHFVQQANAKHLERVRRIKNALMQLLTRVENVHGVLDKLLADDKDMYHLNLTAVALENNLQRHSLGPYSLSRGSMGMGYSLSRRHSSGGARHEPRSHHRSSARKSSSSHHHHHHNHHHSSRLSPGTQASTPTPGVGEAENHSFKISDPSGVNTSYSSSRSRSSSSSSSSGASSFWMSEESRAVAHVEMLVEAYFFRIDQTHNRLQTLHEYIKDTEDLVNTRLDHHLNKLITVDLLLTGLMASLSAMTCVAGFFGENLNSGLMDEVPLFVVVVCSVTGIGLLLYLVFCLVILRSGVVDF